MNRTIVTAGRIHCVEGRGRTEALFQNDNTIILLLSTFRDWWAVPEAEGGSSVDRLILTEQHS